MNIRTLCVIFSVTFAAPAAAEPQGIPGAAVQPAATVGVSCAAAGKAVPADVLKSVVEAPKLVLDTYPRGGPQMIAFVAALTLTEPDLAEKLVTLAGRGAPLQQSAVGLGLAQAARGCEAVSPALSQKIATAVATLNNPIMVSAFRAGRGDPTIAAIGATGGGAGGTAGLGPNAGGNFGTAGGGGGPVGNGQGGPGSQAVQLTGAAPVGTTASTPLTQISITARNTTTTTTATSLSAALTQSVSPAN
jgi:hypothetical protein